MRKGSILVWILAAALFLLAVQRLEEGRQAQGAAQLEAAIRRTAAACYAAEGFYPPSLAYMQEHCGLQYDTRHYRVGYEVFASNLMPEITILEK